VAYGNNQTRLRGAQLAAVYQQLAADRAVLWDCLTRSLHEMLTTIPFSSLIATDDFLAIHWAINVMVKLGTEFCGSKSSVLTSCLKDKARCVE
jgi:hypothetical protein